MIELEHSPLGASGANRWLNCGGSFLMHRDQLESGDFEEVQSEYARLGTAAHELAAKCLILEREPFEFIGAFFDGFEVGAPKGINPDAVAVYVNDCENIHPRNGKGNVLIERTLHHPEIHPLLKGTVDFGYWSTKGMWLRDYKNGEGIGVGAVGNRQLLYYAFLMALEFPWLKAGPPDLPVNLGIVQPNFYGIFEEPDVWVTTLGEVLAYGHDVLLPRMHELTVTRDIGDDDFNLGDHCQFCPVMLDCPKMQRAFMEYAEGTEFIAMLTDEELAHFFELKPHARRFMNALDETVKARLLGGKANIPTAKLVEKKTARVWKGGAEKVLVETFGDKAFEPKKIKSPAQIEKLSTRGKELALEFGYKPQSDMLTIAGLDDPRLAAKPPTNEAVFAHFQKSPVELGF